jgi:hypothetical protein
MSASYSSSIASLQVDVLFIYKCMAADASLGVGVLSVKESNSTPYIIWSNRE